MRAALIIFAMLVLTASARAADPPSNDWSVIRRPSAGPAQAIGFPSHGCLAGAAELPIDGEGYQAIRLTRRRNFGHPELVDFVETLGHLAAAAALPVLYIGDMAQPRGGPLPFGHISHQTGIDVDIWFVLTRHDPLAIDAREDVPLPSMLRPSGALDPAHFGLPQVTLLRLAAADPRVDRIFVNPALKLALCRGAYGASDGGTAWLHTLSPWWGHDDHFHVRLRCPTDSPFCEPQAPSPAGDGCDAGLVAWAHHLKPSKPAVVPPPPATTPPRRQPAACAALMDAP